MAACASTRRAGLAASPRTSIFYKCKTVHSSPLALAYRKGNGHNLKGCHGLGRAAALGNNADFASGFFSWDASNSLEMAL